MSIPPPTPFRLAVPDAAIADLRERLARTRYPDEAPDSPWLFGTSVAYMQELIRYWRERFDWRAQEAQLNGLRQFSVPIRGIDLHFIHEPGRGPRPIPLLLSHGWPGSIVEFRRLIPLLTERFTVVLMTEVLGYRRFAAQGGDWGAFIASVLGWKYPERLTGIHLNLLAVRRDPREPARNPEEAAYLDELKRFLKEETGYQWIQGTKPQTLAFALTDSPAGLAAWIAEKFRKWSDCDGTIENAVSRDDLLTNISLYWFSGAIGSSFWPYYARMHSAWPIPAGATVDVPTAYADFPKEILRPPRSLAARTYTNIQRWTTMKRGGHFAALEQPEALAREICEFLAPAV